MIHGTLHDHFAPFLGNMQIPLSCMLNPDAYAVRGVMFTCDAGNLFLVTQLGHSRNHAPMLQFHIVTYAWTTVSCTRMVLVETRVDCCNDSRDKDWTWQRDSGHNMNTVQCRHKDVF